MVVSFLTKPSIAMPLHRITVVVFHNAQWGPFGSVAAHHQALLEAQSYPLVIIHTVQP